MKGVILAGGLGERLRPLTLRTNKHLLGVDGRPMILYGIECMLAAGVDEVMVVTGRQHVDAFADLLGDGRALGLRTLDYGAQNGAGGVAEALSVAEDFAAGDRVCVLLGDNLFGRSVRPVAEAFAEQASGARLLLARVDDPHRFGVARFEGPSENPTLAEILEKPDTPPSDVAVTGLYFYDADVFAFCRDLRPSARGELEITDVNNLYLARGDLAWSWLEGWWADVGTHESLERAGRLVAEHGANAADAS